MPTEAGCYLGFYEAVAAAVRSGAPALVDPEDAIAALEVIEAARASAERGQIVQLGAT